MRKRFSTEDIRMLAEAERRMDSGLTPFVLLNGQRISVSDGAIAELGLHRGQTINDAIFMAILQHQIAECTTAIELRKAADTARKERSL